MDNLNYQPALVGKACTMPLCVVISSFVHLPRLHPLLQSNMVFNEAVELLLD